MNCWRVSDKQERYDEKSIGAVVRASVCTGQMSAQNVKPTRRGPKWMLACKAMPDAPERKEHEYIHCNNADGSSMVHWISLVQRCGTVRPDLVANG